MRLRAPVLGSALAVALVAGAAGVLGLFSREGESNLPAGQEGGVVVPPRGRVLELLIRGPQGELVTGAHIKVFDASPEGELAPLETASNGQGLAVCVVYSEAPGVRVSAHGYVATFVGTDSDDAIPFEVTLDRAAVVHGRVTDANTGAPVSGATIMSRTGNRVDIPPDIYGVIDYVALTRSSADGGFVLDQLDRFEESTIVVDARGYSRLAMVVQPSDAETAVVRVALEAGGGADVQVLGPQGEAVPGAVVRMIPHVEERQGEEHECWCSEPLPLGPPCFDALTDEDGMCSFAGLTYGTWTAHVQHKTMVQATPPEALTVSPGERFPSITCKLEAGKATLVLTVRSVDGGHVDATSIDVGGRSMEFRAADSSGSQTLAIDGLHPGIRDVLIQASNYAPALLQAHLLPRESTHLVAEFSRGASLEGVVEDESGRPVQGIEVVCAQAIRGSQAERISRTARTGADGRFRLHGLPSGSASVRVQSRFHDGADLSGVIPPRNDLHLRVVRRARVTCTFSVPEGHPRPLFCSRLACIGDRVMNSGHGLIEWNGGSVEWILPPGTGYVGVHVDGLAPSITSVSLTAGELLHLAPRTLQRGLRASGIVRTDDGEPVKGALVMATGYTVETARTDEAGAFVIDSLAPGLVTIRAIARDGAEGGLPIELGEVDVSGLVVRVSAR